MKRCSALLKISGLSFQKVRRKSRRIYTRNLNHHAVTSSGTVAALRCVSRLATLTKKTA